MVGHIFRSSGRIDSHGKRLFDNAVAGSASTISGRSTSRDFGPAIASTPHCVETSQTSIQPNASRREAAIFIR